MLIYGELRPKSKFLGNSAATLMGGSSRVVFLDRPASASGDQFNAAGEEYVIGMPNMYARGILFGKLLLELGDTSTIECAATAMSASVEFKTKGYFSGTYNALEAKVLQDSKQVGLVQGKWSDTMTFTDLRSSSSASWGGKRAEPSVLISVANAPTPAAKLVKPEHEQAPNESRRLWNGVTLSIAAKDMDKATEHKTAIEDAQRAATRQREESGTEFQPHYFVYEKKLQRYLPRLEALPQEFQTEPVVRYFASL